MQVATCSSGATTIYKNSETPIEEHLEPKMEPLLTSNTSLLTLLPSVLLYLCSCLFFCIMVLLLDPFTIIEIISVLSFWKSSFSLSFFPLSSIFSIPCWLHRHNLVSLPICCFCWCSHCSVCVFLGSPLNL